MVNTTTVKLKLCITGNGKVSTNGKYNHCKTVKLFITGNGKVSTNGKYNHCKTKVMYYW